MQAFRGAEDKGFQEVIGLKAFMADNYLEKKFEDMRARASAQQAKEERMRQRAWKKRMDVYRKRLAAEAEQSAQQGAQQDAE